MVFTVIGIRRIYWRGLLFLFYTGNNLLGEIVRKNNHCEFKLKFGTQTNSNIQNSMVVFTFLSYNRNTLFGKRKLTKPDYRF